MGPCLKAAKAIWTVSAGLHQYHIIPEYTRNWCYTSSEYEQDRHVAPDQPTIFSKRDEEVHQYAREITNPAYVNYVKLEFLWV